MESGGTHTLTDNEYNSALYGTWLSTEALTRSATVRRQGDDMTGSYITYQPVICRKWYTK